MSYRHALYTGEDGELTAHVCGVSYTAIFSNLKKTKCLSQYSHPMICAYLFNEVATFNKEQTIKLWFSKLNEHLEQMKGEKCESFINSFRFHTEMIVRELQSCDIESPLSYFDKWLNPVIMDVGHDRYDLKGLNEDIMSFLSNPAFEISIPSNEYSFAESTLKPLCTSDLYQKLNVL